MDNNLEERRKKLLSLNVDQIKDLILDNKLTYDDIYFLIENGKIGEDVISVLIESEVFLVKEAYVDYQNRIKTEYFNHLIEEKPTESFIEAIALIVGASSIIPTMKKREAEFNKAVLEIKVSEKENYYYYPKKRSNAIHKHNAKTLLKSEFFDNKIKEIMEKTRRRDRPLNYKSILQNEEKFNKYVIKMYDKRLKTFKSLTNGLEKNTYINSLVKKYMNTEKIIPYFNKDGSIRSYHTLEDYNAMVYNVRLTDRAWSTTLAKAKEDGIDLFYIEPHPFCCPICAIHQGKIYTEKQLEEAIDEGLKHPNCKCNLIAYEGQKEIERNEENYNTEEWHEKYKIQQKIKGLQLAKSRLWNDLKIYKQIEEFGSYDETKQKVNAINKAIRDLKKKIE